MYLNFHYGFTPLIWTARDEASLTSIKKLHETLLSVLNTPAISPNLLSYGSLQSILQNPGESSCWAHTDAQRGRSPLPMIAGTRTIHHYSCACPWHPHGTSQRCGRVRTSTPKRYPRGVLSCAGTAPHLRHVPRLGDIAQRMVTEINYRTNPNGREKWVKAHSAEALEIHRGQLRAEK